MSIHTAQHLLSAILDTYAEGLNTLSWGFAAYPSLDPPYVELPRSLTWAEAEEVEQKCNEAIERGVKIWVDVDSQQEGFVKTNAAGVRENRGIPDDYENVSCTFACRAPLEDVPVTRAMREEQCGPTTVIE
jgi:Ser-tRNA(Ala) deacylase AlaX